MARITLKQIVKDYPGRRGRMVRAVDRVDLDIADGEFLTVLGPSGGGKTTLLRLVAGLEAVTSGTVALDGRVVMDGGADERDVAMVFQRDALLPHLTARENIELGLRLRGAGRAEREDRMREVEAWLPLGAALDRLPRAMSGGERQRAALARALVRRPRALLLDEPLSHLDAPARDTLRAQLRALHRRLGLTIVLVTHDQAEALALGTRVAVLERGALRQVADPATLYAAPADVFVAGFVGAPPMNLFRGVLAMEGGGVWFHAKSNAGPGAGLAAGAGPGGKAVTGRTGREDTNDPGANDPGAGDGGDRLSLALTEPQVAAWTERWGTALSGGGREVILGLRAEDMAEPWEERPMPYGCEVEATVEAVEFQGAESLARWACGGVRWVTRAPASGPEPAVGGRGRLVMDMAAVRFFDASTGAAVDLGISSSGSSA